MRPRSPVQQEGDRQGGEHGEGAGEDDPGARDHGAGGGSARTTASRASAFARLLAHAAHQEDVVVDPERDQEDEA